MPWSPFQLISKPSTAGVLRTSDVCGSFFGSFGTALQSCQSMDASAAAILQAMHFNVQRLKKRAKRSVLQEEVSRCLSPRFVLGRSPSVCQDVCSELQVWPGRLCRGFFVHTTYAYEHPSCGLGMDVAGTKSNGASRTFRLSFPPAPPFTRPVLFDPPARFLSSAASRLEKACRSMWLVLAKPAPSTS